MSKLRNFIGQIPKLCGAEQEDVRGLRNILVFDYEIKNKNSILKRENFNKNPNSRLDVLFDFDGDEIKKDYCRKLLNIKMYTGYGDADKVSENIEGLKTMETVPEIDSVYSITDATLSVGDKAGWY